jgi:predicted ArsR family transcriptional regulator
MSRKKTRVRYQLDSGGIHCLTDEEIKAILRAADEIIATGGRSMLAKILKGSKDKKVLEHGLDQCPVYGYYKELTLLEITNRID